jgi:hypothetical protein
MYAPYIQQFSENVKNYLQAYVPQTVLKYSPTNALINIRM